MDRESHLRPGDTVVYVGDCPNEDIEFAVANVGPLGRVLAYQDTLHHSLNHALASDPIDVLSVSTVYVTRALQGASLLLKDPCRRPRMIQIDLVSAVDKSAAIVWLSERGYQLQIEDRGLFVFLR